MAVSKLTKVVASYFCPPWNFCAIKKPRPLFSVNFLPHLNFFPNKISLLIFAWNTTSKQFKRQQRLRCCLGQPTRVVVTTNRCRVIRLLQMDELYNASAKVWRSSGRYSSLLLPLQWMLSSSIILTSFKLSTSNTICCKNFFALVEFSSLSLSLSLSLSQLSLSLSTLSDTCEKVRLISLEKTQKTWLKKKKVRLLFFSYLRNAIKRNMEKRAGPRFRQKLRQRVN